MKKLFYIGIIGFCLFEILNVYLIMPMPGSQQMNSVDFAYFLYSYRWFFRIFFLLLILAGLLKVFQSKHKWIPVLAIMICGGITYVVNFIMSADSMFKQPEVLTFKTQEGNELNDSTVVIGVEYNGEAKAYPMRFLTYHHQVQDVVGGKPMIITYCSVCRTGRVFEPIVKGKHETFRLVGMDHFNAMFEDATTKSWWRQATGQAITGALKGNALPEVESTQLTIGTWFQLHPDAVVMQLDAASKSSYDTLGRFELGKSKGQLTRTDSVSWKDKSWVIGIQIGKDSKAYDWNLLKQQHVINDKVGGQPIVIALSKDGSSFVSFQRSDADVFIVRNDSLMANNKAYDFSGRSSDITEPLKKVAAYQEFWHSWRTFHPNTEKYNYAE
ncbi:MAG TPA: DUF3179 domain-containing (seleno)protein [Chryseolinea sp.]|nr:DUF3179 domain-containing (seleno)protein [Chryseolinea sp.]